MGSSVKIDIHTHTRKCKSGDAATREITAEDFCGSILSTEVRVIAITNHNVFDLAQFEDIRKRIGTDAQVWPGVELDVHDDKTKGHLLVITSPDLAAQLSAAVIERMVMIHRARRTPFEKCACSLILRHSG